MKQENKNLNELPQSYRFSELVSSIHLFLVCVLLLPLTIILAFVTPATIHPFLLVVITGGAWCGIFGLLWYSFMASFKGAKEGYFNSICCVILLFPLLLYALLDWAPIMLLCVNVAVFYVVSETLLSGGLLRVPINDLQRYMIEKKIAKFEMREWDIWSWVVDRLGKCLNLFHSTSNEPDVMGAILESHFLRPSFSWKEEKAEPDVTSYFLMQSDDALELIRRDNKNNALNLLLNIPHPLENLGMENNRKSTIRNESGLVVKPKERGGHQIMTCTQFHYVITGYFYFVVAVFFLIITFLATQVFTLPDLGIVVPCIIVIGTLFIRYTYVRKIIDPISRTIEVEFYLAGLRVRHEVNPINQYSEIRYKIDFEFRSTILPSESEWTTTEKRKVNDHGDEKEFWIKYCQSLDEASAFMNKLRPGVVFLHCVLLIWITLKKPSELHTPSIEFPSTSITLKAQVIRPLSETNLFTTVVSLLLQDPLVRFVEFANSVIFFDDQPAVNPDFLEQDPPSRIIFAHRTQDPSPRLTTNEMDYNDEDQSQKWEREVTSEIITESPAPLTLPRERQFAEELSLCLRAIMARKLTKKKYLLVIHWGRNCQQFAFNRVSKEIHWEVLLNSESTEFRSQVAKLKGQGFTFFQGIDEVRIYSKTTRWEVSLLAQEVTQIFRQIFKVDPNEEWKFEHIT